MDSGPGDEMLLLAVAGRDMGAFRTLYERHAGWLAIRLARRCNDRDLVADAIQDTFVAVWQKPRGFRGDGDIAAWLSLRRVRGRRTAPHRSPTRPLQRRSRLPRDPRHRLPHPGQADPSQTNKELTDEPAPIQTVGISDSARAPPAARARSRHGRNRRSRLHEQIQYKYPPELISATMIMAPRPAPRAAHRQKSATFRGQHRQRPRMRSRRP
jgi:hypothetical protein